MIIDENYYEYIENIYYFYIKHTIRHVICVYVVDIGFKAIFILLVIFFTRLQYMALNIIHIYLAPVCVLSVYIKTFYTKSYLYCT